LHEHDSTICTVEAIKNATERGHFEIVKYLCEDNNEISHYLREVIEIARYGIYGKTNDRHTKIIDYLKKRYNYNN